MNLFRLIALGAAVASLGACTSYLAVNDAGDTTAKAPAATTPVTPVKGDTCGASKLQYLVGKPKEEAPVPADLSKRRVYCSSCIDHHGLSPGPAGHRLRQGHRDRHCREVRLG